MHILQTTLTPLDGLPEALYLRLRLGQTPRALPPLDQGVIELNAGEVLSTDTFLGSFYRSWWLSHTHVRDVAIVVGFRGRAAIRVFEDTGQGVVLLCDLPLQSAVMGRHLVRFRPTVAEAGRMGSELGSRIFAEIHVEQTSALASLDFVTELAPPHDVSLSLGLSTFNGTGSRIGTLLPALAALAAQEPAIRAIHVVNHGKPLEDAAVAAPCVHVAAPAAGDAPGGLSQTLAAARAAADCATYHMFLADDLLLDPRLIARILPFLRYARAPMVLGGAILDVQRPKHLHGAGALLATDGHYRLLGRDRDLTEIGALGQFDAPLAVDYCPWWLCLVPLDPALSPDLPPGPYLRGDDEVYGQEAARLGAASLCLPGFAAWHQTQLALPDRARDPAPGTVDLSNRFMPLHRRAADAPIARRTSAGSGRLYLLQSALFPEGDLPETVYLRSIPPRRRGDLLPHQSIDGRRVIRLDQGNILSTDTFFGSFYRAYWQTYTAVREIVVAVELRGSARVKVFEDAGHGSVLLAEQRLQATTPRRFLIDILPSDLRLLHGETETRPSRIYVEIDAERPSDLHAVDILSPTPPQRQTRLSIGLCTFNQETYFARTLDVIARLAAATPQIRAVHVVNQGAPFQSPAIRALLTAPKINAIEQANLGGCGGFTRSLVEELEAKEPATHHLMMDDDIVLDERMILRALRFLDYATAEIALGAGMLDSLRPTVMYEAGAFLRDDNTIHPYCHNVELADPAQLWRFNAPVKTDYNAWWFCILPLERARALELPAPVFIRGDDFEYGQRLARAGVPTVTLPGIGVWHEPFYAKPSGWQDYYDMRNRLIFGATYGDKVRQLSLAHVAGLITTAILTHNYMSAELRMKAVRDFLGGPQKLFARSPEVLHQEVMALAKRDAPEKLGPDWKQRPTSEGRRPRPTTMRAMIGGQLRAMLRTGLAPLIVNSDAVLMDADAHPGNTAGRRYVLTNGPRSFHLRFRPKRWRMWTMMARTVMLILRYRSARVGAGRDWAARIADYRKPAWWAPVFARPAAATPAAAAAKAAPAAPATAPAPAAKPAAKDAPGKLEKV